MPDVLDTVLYYATTPIRLFGRSRAFPLCARRLWSCSPALLRRAVGARPFPAGNSPPPALANLPPLPALQPVTRSSYVIAPVAVSLSAIRDQPGRRGAARARRQERQSGEPTCSSKAEIGITVSRGPMTVAGRPTTRSRWSRPLTGTIHITGQLGSAAGQAVGGIGDAIGGLLGRSLGKQIETLAHQECSTRPRCARHR